VLATVVVDENFDTAQLGERSNRTLVGSVESIAEQVQAKVLDNGVTGIVFNIPFHRPGDITALGEALAPLLRG
jgi:alkanesulfonate monooxygenase SsuD/methylene tetrahydromethanopterin reductase-like flavin-dependent oxidoreductase (luciferase family)